MTTTTDKECVLAAQRFFSWAEYRKHSQLSLAKSLDVSAQALTNWKRRGIPPGRIVSAARLMGISAEQLIGAHEVETPVSPVGTPVPLLSFSQAAQDAPRWDACIYTDIPVGSRSFALTIRGGAMEPRFRSGDRVIIDPDVTPEPGDYVAAVVAGNSEAVFRRYRVTSIADDHRPVVELVPTNPDFPAIHSARTPLTVPGTMVEHRSYRK